MYCYCILCGRVIGRESCCDRAGIRQYETSRLWWGAVDLSWPHWRHCWQQRPS